MSLHELREWHDRTGVYADREAAGRALAAMLEEYRDGDALVLAIPTRGVPVAAVVARELGLPLDVLVVKKISFPWNPEAGFGAVACDGTVILHRALVRDMALRPTDIDKGERLAREQVAALVETLRGGRPLPDLAGRCVLLVDEGVASSITLQAAIGAVRKAGAARVIVGLATGFLPALERIEPEVDEVYCPNVRGGWGFDILRTYTTWREVGPGEAARVLAEFQG